MKHTDNKCPNKEKEAELEHRDIEMSEQLGEDASDHQPFWLREKIHLGRLKIKQTDGHALPVKQHQENHVRRGQLRARRAESKCILTIVVSMGWLVDMFVVGQIMAMERNMCPVGVPLMIRQQWTPEQVVKIPSPHKTKFSSFRHGTC